MLLTQQLVGRDYEGFVKMAAKNIEILPNGNILKRVKVEKPHISDKGEVEWDGYMDYCYYPIEKPLDKITLKSKLKEAGRGALLGAGWGAMAGTPISAAVGGPVGLGIGAGLTLAGSTIGTYMGYNEPEMFNNYAKTVYDRAREIQSKGRKLPTHYSHELGEFCDDRGRVIRV